MFNSLSIYHNRLSVNSNNKTHTKGCITKDTYDRKHQKYQDQIQTLEIELSEHTKADYNNQTTVATVISVARRAKTIFEKSSEIAKKRTFLNYILQNPTVTGKVLTFQLKKPFDLVLNLANTQTKTAANSDGCPVWLRDQGFPRFNSG